MDRIVGELVWEGVLSSCPLALFHGEDHVCPPNVTQTGATPRAFTEAGRTRVGMSHGGAALTIAHEDRIVAEGTQDDLLDRDDLCAALWLLQASDEETQSPRLLKDAG